MKLKTILIAFLSIMMLSSCSLFDSFDNNHEHTFSRTWSYDKDYHWHETICGHNVIEDKEYHNFEKKIVDPTFEEKGYTLYECSICDYSYNEDETDILKHNYSSEWSYDNDSHFHSCTDKGYEDLRRDEKEHDFITSLDSNDAVTKTCSICGYEIHLDPEYKCMYFSFNDDGCSYELRYCGEIEGSLIIPSTYNGLPVTSINYRAFNRSKITSITIPETIESIGYGIFEGCTSLKTVIVDEKNPFYDSRDNCNAIIETKTNKLIAACNYSTIPESVEAIASESFIELYEITSITIPSTINKIEKGSFKNCSQLKTIKVSDDNKFYDSRNNCNAIIDSITDELIVGCNTSNVPDGVTGIADYAFYGNFGNGAITLPDSITRIGVSAFEETGVNSIKLPKELLIIDERAFYDANLFTLTIPDKVISIGDHAFADCYHLTSTSIPDGINFIGEYAFLECRLEYNYYGNCKYLGNNTNPYLVLVSVDDINSPISISNDTKIILEEAFDKCTNLTFNTIDDYNYLGNDENPYLLLYSINNKDIKKTSISNQTKFIWHSVFEYCKKLKIVNIPDSVISIYDYAFHSCNNVNELYISKNAEYIGNSAFDNNGNSLTSIEIPSKLKIINKSSFEGNHCLENLIIPESVIIIHKDAFSTLYNLESIVIPKNVMYIDNNNLSNCSNLKSIIVDKENKYYDSRDNCNAIIETKTNKLIAGCYKTQIPSDVTTIAQWSFVGCYFGYSQDDDCTTIKIPESVRTIEDYAFYVTDLTSITIPEGVVEIGNISFDSYQLEKISISSTVRSLESESFGYGSDLLYINVDSKNKYYDSRDNCNAIIEKNTNKLILGSKNTIIPKTIISIGNDAFTRNRLIESIVIPSNITKIEDMAFLDCSNLSSITLSEGLQTIGRSTFSGCNLSGTLELPNGLISIGSYAFSHNNINKTLISKSVKFIDNNPFSGNSYFNYLKVEKENEYYDSRSNSNAIIETATNTLISATNNTIIPKTVKYLGDYSFYGLKGKTYIVIPTSILSLGYRTFLYCDNLIYYLYSGTKEQFESIEDRNFENIDLEKVYYYSETEPTEEQKKNGKYWYSKNGEIHFWL